MDKFFFSILLILLVSCSSTTPADCALGTAETIMDQHPDSALMILQSIPTDQIKSDGQRALYGLLLAQALHKNYIDIKSDSIIAPAIEFYEKSHDRRRLSKALYYSAQIDYNHKEYSKSLISLFRAYELASELNDSFWIGLTAQCISDIYHDNYCVNEEQYFATIALENFRLTGKKAFINHGLYAIARSYHCVEDYASSIQIAKGLIDSARIYNDIPLRDKAWELIGLGNLAMNKYEDAYEAFRENFRSTEATASDSAYYCVVSLKSGRVNDAQIIIPELLNSPNLPEHLNHWIRYNYYKALDSIKHTYKMLESMNIDSDNALKEARHQNLVGSVMEHYAYNESIDKAKLKLQQAYTVIVFIVAIIIIILIFKYVRKRHLRQQAIIEEYIGMYNDMKHLVEQSSKDNDAEIIRVTAENESQPTSSILEKYFSEFDLLGKSILNDDSSVSPKNVYAKVRQLIDSFGNDTVRLNELENYANYRYDNVMAKIRVDFPNLKEIDYRVFLFSRLGFSIPTITLLTKNENNRSAIYNRRKRLRERFRQFTGTNRPLYLDVLP